LIWKVKLMRSLSELPSHQLYQDNDAVLNPAHTKNVRSVGLSSSERPTRHCDRHSELVASKLTMWEPTQGKTRNGQKRIT